MPFDPRQPFEVISAPSSGFDPNAPFEIIPPEASKPLTRARVAEIGGDVASEAGGAIAGQMIGLAGGPLAPVTVPLGGFIGGGIGNTIAQTRRMARGEQDGFRFGELLASSAISAIPGGAVAKGASTAARIGRTAAVMGGASTAGSVVQQAIDRPEGESIDLGQAALSGAIGAAGGAVMQGGVEAATPLFTKLASVFKRTPPATFERAGPEMVNAIAKAEGIYDEPRFRDEIAKLEVDMVALEMLVLRVLSAEKTGKNSLDIAGLLKIRGSELQQRYTELMMLAAGPFSLPFMAEAMDAGWQGDQVHGGLKGLGGFPGGALHCAPLASTYFNMRKTTIYGGSNEVQRNIVAKTVLG